MAYQELDFRHPAYDYHPSVLWDPSIQLWVMYNCGYHTAPDGFSGDGIFRSVSRDGVAWSTPEITLAVGPPGAWDDRHVCHQSVLHDPAIAINGHHWVMWYTGLHDRTRFTLGPNKIGMAWSDDGVVWTKGNGPVIDCGDDPDTWGCGHPSVVFDPLEGFTMSHTRYLCANPSCRLNTVLTSSDGLRWSGATYASPESINGKEITPGAYFRFPNLQVGPDLVRARGSWYLATGGDSACGGDADQLASEVIVWRSATMPPTRDTLAQAGCLSYTDMRSANGSAGRFVAEPGFYRTGSGGQPTASPTSASTLWLAFGLASIRYHHVSEEIRGARYTMARS